jgi:Uma2 family endonuclease
MTTSLTQGITLEDFLKLPYLENSPAWEYLHGVAIQKPMPKTRHSILQKRLLAEVDSHTADYTALPELRCTFGERSIVPDVAVIAWNRINLNQAGEPEDDFREAPDWTIEILSPDQKVNRVTRISHKLRKEPALLDLVGKMYSKIQSCWRGSGRNHTRHRGHKDRSYVS